MPYTGMDPGVAIEHALRIAADLFGSTGEAMAVVDYELRIREWTPQLEQLSGHTREQMVEADVLGQIIVGAEPQARHGVEIAVARRQENDREAGRSRTA